MRIAARRIWRVFCLVLVVSALALPSSWGAETADSTNVLTENHVILRIAGTRIMGRMLLPQLVAYYLGHKGDSSIEVNPGQPPWNVAVTGVGALGHTDIVLIKFTQEDKAFEELAAGRVDLVMMLHSLGGREEAALAPTTGGWGGSRGGKSSTMALGKVGGAVMVNPSNPIRSLTEEQIAGIFTGRINDWSEVGGRQGRIHVYIPDNTDIEAVLFRALGTGLSLVRGATREAEYPPFRWPLRASRESALARSVAADPDGITFMLQPFPGNLKTLAVQAPSGIDYFPTSNAISDGDYAFCAHLYLFAAPGNETPTLVSFLGSMTESDVIVAHILAGLEPPGIALFAVTPKAGVPESYRMATADSLRISQTIHFPDPEGTMTLKLSRELDAVAKFLTRLELSPGRVRLLSFVNPGRDPKESARRSFALGAIVKRELEKRHILGVKVYGFGGAMPLEPGRSWRQRERNRRVEIWVSP